MHFDVREALWLQRIWKTFGGGCTGSVKFNLQANNQSGMGIAKNDVCNEQRKHVDVNHHFVRNHVGSGVLKLRYILTEEMGANIMTKALAARKHHHFMNGMGMRCPEMSAENYFENEGEC